jgi:uncharacterized OsmC-like protein
MKIFVAGATGAIGRPLLAQLLARGHDVVALTVTGEGLAQALAGAQMVVDVANAPSWEDNAVLAFFETSGRNLVADEPVSVGGGDAGPDPYDYLLTALGVCTSMTIGFYARRNRLPLENITVSLSHSRIYAADCEECETKEGMLDRIDVEVELTGPLTPEQHAKLMQVAAKCPVHRTLTSEINIRLKAAEKS